MAQIVQLPVSFEFRTVRVKWQARKSRIVGVSWDAYGGGWKLKAIATGRGRKAEAEFSSDDVPARLWDQCSKKVDKSKREEYWSNADGAIESICADFQPQLLVASVRNHYREDEEKDSLPADAWQLRDDFLCLGADVANVVAFLNRWGRWNHLDYVLPHRLLSFQQEIRGALISPPHKWLSSGLNRLNLYRESAYPYLTLDTFECSTAICNSVTIDLLREVKFRACGRLDCGQPFPITSRHRRTYCSWYCGHLESVRRGRASSRESRIGERRRAK